jgi:ActR/RegA family two-component response regulator
MVMEQIQGEVRTKAPEILVMEDETSLAKGLRMILEKEGYHVDTASTGQSAMDALRQKGFDLLVADLRLPDMDGMDIIREVKEKRPETKTIVITGYPSISSAVDAMKLGVSDYLPKPFWDEDFKSGRGEGPQGRQGSTPEAGTGHSFPSRPDEAGEAGLWRRKARTRRAAKGASHGGRAQPGPRSQDGALKTRL